MSDAAGVEAVVQTVERLWMKKARARRARRLRRESVESRTSVDGVTTWRSLSLRSGWLVVPPRIDQNYIGTLAEL